MKELRKEYGDAVIITTDVSEADLKAMYSKHYVLNGIGKIDGVDVYQFVNPKELEYAMKAFVK